MNDRTVRQLHLSLATALAAAGIFRVRIQAGARASLLDPDVQSWHVEGTDGVPLPAERWRSILDALARNPSVRSKWRVNIINAITSDLALENGEGAPEVHLLQRAFVSLVPSAGGSSGRVEAARAVWHALDDGARDDATLERLGVFVDGVCGGLAVAPGLSPDEVALVRDGGPSSGSIDIAGVGTEDMRTARGELSYPSRYLEPWPEGEHEDGWHVRLGGPARPGVWKFDHPVHAALAVLAFRHTREIADSPPPSEEEVGD